LISDLAEKGVKISKETAKKGAKSPSKPADAAKEVKVNKNDYFFSNKRKSDWEKLFEDFGAQSWVDSIKEKLVGSLLGDFSSYFFELKHYSQMKGVQMRMLYQVTI
jgi:hypothetical protein